MPVKGNETCKMKLEAPAFFVHFSSWEIVNSRAFLTRELEMCLQQAWEYGPVPCLREKKKKKKGERDLERSRKARGRLAACEASSPSQIYMLFCLFGSIPLIVRHLVQYCAPSTRDASAFAVLLSLQNDSSHKNYNSGSDLYVSKHSSAWHHLQNVKAMWEKLLQRGFLNRPVTHSIEVQLSVTEDSVLWITAVWYWLRFTKTVVAWAVRQ